MLSLATRAFPTIVHFNLNFCNSLAGQGLLLGRHHVITLCLRSWEPVLRRSFATTPPFGLPCRRRSPSRGIHSRRCFHLSGCKHISRALSGRRLESASRHCETPREARGPPSRCCGRHSRPYPALRRHAHTLPTDRKSTRLNSSHLGISYAVFC